jgi:F-type H+-transporting ATPase subunit epsilon
MAIKFKIVTPERVVYENDVLQVSIPTTTGEITILPSHVPLISVVSAGELKIKDASGEHTIAIAGGAVEVRTGNEVVILADNAERADEIDIARAEEARVRAEEQMQQLKNAEDVDYAKIQALMDRELNRIRIGKKYRKLP